MMEVSLREFANRSEVEVLEWLNQPYKVKLTDDEGQVLETNTYDLMISWYGLETHRHYNELPYQIKEVVKCEAYADSDLQAPINHFQEILSEIVDDPVEVDKIKRIDYAWQTKLNNFLVIFSQRGVVSASARDVQEVMDMEVISDIRTRYYDGKITIDEAEAEFKVAILSHPSLDNHNFPAMARTGDVSVNQGFQLMITLGNRFDINNSIFPNPIKPSYGEGIVNLADIIAENRSAGKALVSNGKALEDSEWFHRKLHLLANVVTGIQHQHDCGTTTTIPIKITSKAILRSLAGKYYYDEEEEKFLPMNRRRMKKFNLGDIVHCRTIEYCRSPGGTPCGVCYGKMKAMVPYNVIMQRSANPGMLSATAIAERIGQSLLSTKHFMRHTVTKPFVVCIGDDPYITTDGDNIFLTKTMVQEGTYLVFPSSMVKELSDLSSIENLDDINEEMLTNFGNATFQYKIEDPMVPGTFSEQTIHVTTTVSSRRARMSKELIDYVIENGWERDRKDILIDLSKFNHEDPLFFLPYVHEDLNQYRLEIEQYLALTRRNNIWKSREVTPEIFSETLNEFWTLINRKFEGFNIIHAETLLYCITAKDPERGLYGLPEGDEPRYFAPFKHCIENRDFGNFIIYQGQIKVLENPKSFQIPNRQPSALGAFVKNAFAE